MNLLFFLQKTSIFHKNYINIQVNKLLNVKRSENMFMCVDKFEKSLILNCQASDQRLRK